MMKKNKISIKTVLISLLFFSFLQILFSCSQTPQYESSLSETISPSTCRIVGTVEAIEDIKDTSGPCSTNPCVATVKIDNVIARGMGFSNALSANDIIHLKFAFTLSPTTEEMFPKLNYQFPGLKVGDKFQGDIEKVLSINLQGSETPEVYQIFNYDVVK